MVKLEKEKKKITCGFVEHVDSKVKEWTTTEEAI